MSATVTARMLTMPGWAESVRAFRELARSVATTAYQADLAALCVSELVTNAIEHTWSGWPRGLVTVEFGPGRDPGGLRITVTDDGSMGGPPRPWLWPSPETGEPAQSGYGLSIVDTLASDWGRFTAPAGWSVWCEIPAAAL
jgi:anti-sigma regulatory factor (Ser/Thr protein kinase)